MSGLKQVTREPMVGRGGHILSTAASTSNADFKVIMVMVRQMLRVPFGPWQLTRTANSQRDSAGG
jgi:hypothetical protein